MFFNKITKRIIVAIIDILILIISLYLSLSLRNLEIISKIEFIEIAIPFSIIFILNIIIFYIYGLYEKMTVKIYRELNKRILYSQILSSILGSLIFYTLPYFSIAPKTILIIYILISSILIFIWRYYARIFIKSNDKNKILIVAEGKELFELLEEIKENKILNIKEFEYIDLANFNSKNIFSEIKKRIEEKKLNMIVINMHHYYIKNSIPLLYELYLQNINIINFANFYEEIFERIPLDNIDAGWFFENLYKKDRKFYTKIKRIKDLLISIPAFIISLPFYPIIYLILKYQDNGDLFFIAERIGKDNKPFKLYKFRTMTQIKNEDINFSDKNEGMRITKFGKILRKSRIDELPQLWNIIIGDLSLIGPRPELPELVKEYKNQIAFYDIRHSVTPGLSGFAQIFQDQDKVPKYGIDTEATKIKLSYDIYYLKHRSLLFDLSLILKTIKILLQKTGL